MEMAFSFSVDAQEFIPGTATVPLKPKLCTSLSVDAAIFVPVVNPKVQRENSSPFIGKKVDKSSTVQRRGRFAQVDCRVQANKKSIDCSSKTPTPDEKPPTSTNSLGHKKPFSPKNVTGPKKLRQSFSLEYSKHQKHTSPPGEEKKQHINDIPINRTPVNFTSNSGESKPIILWSSIVKKEANKEKSGDDNSNQIPSSVKAKSVTDENPVSTKKYSKNKVTRTKNVLSEPPNEKYGHKTLHEWKKRDIDQDLAFQEAEDKSIVEFPKFITDSVELVNKIENKSQILSNNFTHKHSPVIKNFKRGNSEKAVRPDIDLDPEKSMCENFNFEAHEDKKIVKNIPVSDISYTRTLENDSSKANVNKEGLDKWLDKKVNVKKNIVKKIPDLNTGLNEIDKLPNKGMKVVMPSQNNNNHIPTENKQEDIKSLNLSDNINFPSLTGGSMTTTLPRLSYSDVAKKVIPLNATPMPSTEKKDTPKVMHDIQLTEDEKRILKKRQKKEKRKMKVKQKKQEARMGEPKKEVLQKQPEKASDREVSFDLSDMFTRLLKVSTEKKSQKLMKVKKTSGIISVVSGLAKKNTPAGKKVERNKYGTTHTIMDGNTPIRKRGKERETPKKKRPTLLKKVITAERERKRLQVEENSALEGVDMSKELVLQERSITSMEEHEGEKVEYISGYPEAIWKKIHSKKFREYCDHILTKDINQLTYNLLVTLQKFQDRVYHENPTKYKQKRRFILGLREVLKHLKLKRLKAVIIAPNIERISAKGGLDDYLGSIISICNDQDIPKIFAMNRHVLGRIIKKLAPVSVVGIFNYDGAHEIFKELLVHMQSAKAEYIKKVTDLNEDNSTTVISPQETRNIIPDSINNQEQKKEKGNRENKVNQRMLDRLYINEYKQFDGDSESDAWITDNESTPF